MNPDKIYTGRSTIRMYRADCAGLMKTGKWDLAIVDPPYGIGANKMTLGNGKQKVYRGSDDWDSKPPEKQYFIKLFDITKNQVLWGANHYIEQFSKNSSCWIFWDKGTGMNDYADGELGWTSFDSVVKKYFCGWVGANAKEKNDPKRTHPTQKPVQLYKWLLTNYAKEGDTIFDSHGGSMSIAIACWDLGFDLDICELDKEYFDAAVKRFENHIAQQTLF